MSSMLRALRILGWVAAVVYVSAGFAELQLANDSNARRIGFCAALVACAAFVVGGISLIERRPWPGAALAAIGAVVAGFSILWTVIGPLLAIAISLLSLLVARRLPSSRERARSS
jgi:ABC-type glucose/galactose transport system permease subunit